jgi:hypothetical protein
VESRSKVNCLAALFFSLYISLYQLMTRSRISGKLCAASRISTICHAESKVSTSSISRHYCNSGYVLPPFYLDASTPFLAREQ